MTATTVEIYRDRERLTSHARSYVRGRHTTKPEHMPASHQKHLEWTPSRIIRWGETIGPSVAALVARIIESRRHPEHGESTLKHGLDRDRLDDPTKPARPGLVHENVRGRDYYH